MAQPVDDNRTLDTRHWLSFDTGGVKRTTWAMDALVGAAVDGGRDGGAVQATASVAGAVWMRRGGDALGAGGQLDLQAATAPLALEQWATGERTAGPVTALRLTHRFTWDVTPPRLATPRERGDGLRAESLELAFPILACVEYGPGDTSVSDEWLPIEGIGRYQIGGAGGSTADGSAALSVFRRRRARAGRVTRETSIMAADLVEIRTWADDDLGRRISVTGVVTSVDFVRLLRTHGTLQWRAGIGVAALLSARSSTLAESDACLESGGTDCRPARKTPIGYLGLTWAALGGEATLSLRRQGLPLYDASLVVDNRIALAVRRDRGRWRTQARAELAWDQLETHPFADHPAASYAVGGLTGEVAYDAKRYAVRGYLELGRSVYWPGATLDHPTLGATVGVSLHVRAGAR